VFLQGRLVWSLSCFSFFLDGKRVIPHVLEKGFDYGTFVSYVNVVFFPFFLLSLVYLFHKEGVR